MIRSVIIMLVLQPGVSDTPRQFAMRWDSVITKYDLKVIRLDNLTEFISRRQIKQSSLNTTDRTTCHLLLWERFTQQK